MILKNRQIRYTVILWESVTKLQYNLLRSFISNDKHKSHGEYANTFFLGRYTHVQWNCRAILHLETNLPPSPASQEVWKYRIENYIRQTHDLNVKLSSVAKWNMPISMIRLWCSLCDWKGKITRGARWFF